MKTNLNFIGIDVSKNTLDVCVLSDQTESFIIGNNKKQITAFFTKILKDKSKYFHICAENTGKYSWELMSILSTLECNAYLVNPLHLKRSLGLTRGKNDKIDAIRIAHFIKKNFDEVSIFIPKRDVIEQLQILLCERKFRVHQRKQLATKNKELKVLKNKEIAKKIIAQNNRLVKELTLQLKCLESEIKTIIKDDAELRILEKQLKSVPGVGNILCWNLIVKTNEFKTITEPRKLACYSGVAPFRNTSGISVFGKNRVSNLADKSLKKLLHLGAMSAVRLENDLALYYQRKASEGKNKMLVLNAVRNKIIHLIFALIKNQTFYQNRLVTS